MKVCVRHHKKCNGYINEMYCKDCKRGDDDDKEN